MGATTAVVLTVAVVAIAIVQLGLLVAGLIAGRRLLAQLVPLLAALTEAVAHLQAATDRIGDLAGQTGETVAAARQAAARVGAIAGSGRSLIEGALGAALLRRVLPGAGAAASGSGAAVKAGFDLALHVYRAVAAHRAARHGATGPPPGSVAGAAALAGGGVAAAKTEAPTRRGLRTGTIRRLPVPEGGRDAPATGT